MKNQLIEMTVVEIEPSDPRINVSIVPIISPPPSMTMGQIKEIGWPRVFCVRAEIPDQASRFVHVEVPRYQVYISKEDEVRERTGILEQVFRSPEWDEDEEGEKDSVTKDSLREIFGGRDLSGNKPIESTEIESIFWEKIYGDPISVIISGHIDCRDVTDVSKIVGKRVGGEKTFIPIKFSLTDKTHGIMNEVWYLLVEEYSVKEKRIGLKEKEFEELKQKGRIEVVEEVEPSSVGRK